MNKCFIKKQQQYEKMNKKLIFFCIFIFMIIVFPVDIQALSSSSSVSYLQQNDHNVDQLILIQILFRHGDRTPVMLYKTDPYKAEQFVEGLGQLTKIGKQRLFQYGQLLRLRYSHYLGNLKREKERNKQKQ